CWHTCKRFLPRLRTLSATKEVFQLRFVPERRASSGKMGSNIVHQYFKKEIEGVKIIVKVDPIRFIGVELTVSPEGQTETRSLEFDEAIFEDLKVGGFVEVGPLEFNLLQSGLNGA